MALNICNGCNHEYINVFDIDACKIRSLQKALEELKPERYKRFRFLHASFADLLKMDLDLNAAISPAKMLLFYDGGVDAAYLEAFPNIQNDAQTLMKQFSTQTRLGRPCLCIGSAIRVATQSSLCPYVIAAPTMFLPEDIRGTENVRHALWAALRLTLEFGDAHDVAIPCMGTGYGKMSAQECAREIDAAFDMPILCKHDDLVSAKPGWWYVRKNVACRQPNTYSNSEVQDN